MPTQPDNRYSNGTLHECQPLLSNRQRWAVLVQERPFQLERPHHLLNGINVVFHEQLIT